MRKNIGIVVGKYLTLCISSLGCSTSHPQKSVGATFVGHGVIHPRMSAQFRALRGLLSTTYKEENIQNIPTEYSSQMRSMSYFVHREILANYASPDKVGKSIKIYCDTGIL